MRPFNAFLRRWVQTGLLAAALLVSAVSAQSCAQRQKPVVPAASPAPDVPTAQSSEPSAPPSPAPGAAPGVLKLRESLDALFAAPEFARSIWAVAVESVDSGEQLYTRNADTLVMPASTLKILTVAAAAERLGWDYRFETRLLMTGPIVEGTLRGDLVVTGNGDPTIQGDDAALLFDIWAHHLSEMGVRHVDGHVIGDGRLFGTERYGFGWSWDDLPAGFSAPVDGLQYNENVVGLTVRPGGSPGMPAAVDDLPESSGLVLDNQVVTVGADAPFAVSTSRLPGSAKVTLSGSVPLGTPAFVRTVSVDDPAAYFARAFAGALRAHGIVIAGAGISADGTDDPAYPNTALVEAHLSPPLGAIATRIMKVSQNLYAETLLRALGAETGTPTFAGGTKVVRDVLTQWGVPGDSFVIVDGSGLSRYNYVAPRTLVTALAHVARDARHGAAFEATLPVGGGDGTLERRMGGETLAGRVRAKTGSMTNVRALAGFVRTVDGERLAFALIANNFSGPAARINQVTDQAVLQLTELRRR